MSTHEDLTKHGSRVEIKPAKSPIRQRSAKRKNRPERLAMDVDEAQLVARLRQVCAPHTFGTLQQTTGIHRETVRRYIRGESRVSALFVSRIVQKLGVSADWLLTGKGTSADAEDTELHT